MRPPHPSAPCPGSQTSARLPPDSQPRVAGAWPPGPLPPRRWSRCGPNNGARPVSARPADHAGGRALRRRRRLHRRSSPRRYVFAFVFCFFFFFFFFFLPPPPPQRKKKTTPPPPPEKMMEGRTVEQKKKLVEEI